MWSVSTEDVSTTFIAIKTDTNLLHLDKSTDAKDVEVKLISYPRFDYQVCVPEAVKGHKDLADIVQRLRSSNVTVVDDVIGLGMIQNSPYSLTDT